MQKMNKQNKIKQILETLLEKGKMEFSEAEIENAIAKTLLLADQRSIDQWFRLMFRIELFIQPRLGYYKLLISEVQRFDVRVDEKQESLDVNL